MNIVEKPTSKYYIEDDKFWKLGNSIYYNPDDPAIFIKSRFGPGHTVNVGTVLGKMVVFLGIVVIFAALIIYLLTSKKTQLPFLMAPQLDELGKTSGLKPSMWNFFSRDSAASTIKV